MLTGTAGCVQAKGIAMSTLAGISGSGSSNLLRILQNLSETNSVSSSSGTAESPQGPEEFLTSELEKQGYTGSQLSDLQAKIETAVQSVQSSSSGPADPSKIHDAINSALKDAGVDTDQIDADFQTQHPQGPRGAGGPPPGGMGAMAGTTGSSSTSSTDTSISTLLTQLGVDPENFESALESALQNAGSTGTIDLSKLFASAGTGSQVDTYA
jgi:hypothetical protein